MVVVVVVGIVVAVVDVATAVVVGLVVVELVVGEGVVAVPGVAHPPRRITIAISTRFIDSDSCGNLTQCPPVCSNHYGHLARPYPLSVHPHRRLEVT
jgi:hypothetical protein